MNRDEASGSKKEYPVRFNSPTEWRMTRNQSKQLKMVVKPIDIVAPLSRTVPQSNEGGQSSKEGSGEESGSQSAFGSIFKGGSTPKRLSVPVRVIRQPNKWCVEGMLNFYLMGQEFNNRHHSKWPITEDPRVLTFGLDAVLEIREMFQWKCWDSMATHLGKYSLMMALKFYASCAAIIKKKAPPKSKALE